MPAPGSGSTSTAQPPDFFPRLPPAQAREKLRPRSSAPTRYSGQHDPRGRSGLATVAACALPLGCTKRNTVPRRATHTIYPAVLSSSPSSLSEQAGLTLPAPQRTPQLDLLHLSALTVCFLGPHDCRSGPRRQAPPCHREVPQLTRIPRTRSATSSPNSPSAAAPNARWSPPSSAPKPE